MQPRKPVLMLTALVLIAPGTSPARSASDDDALLALRAELESMREDYETRIAALEARLAELETQKRADDLAELRRAAEAAAAVPSDIGAESRPSTEGPSVGRERNLSRLNPEISVTGIVLANSADPGRSEFQAQEFELDLQAALDPYSRTRVTLAIREEGIEIEEGYVSYSSLPTGLDLTVGRVRQRWGLLNRQHRHALPQSDYPLAYQVYFGEEGLAQTGVSAHWLLPKLWASSNELSVEVTNGENEAAFAGELFENMSLLARFTNYWDLSPAAYLEWGLSGISGTTDTDGVSRVYGTDLSYRWSPPARALYRGMLWRTELLWSQKDDELGQRQESWGGYSYLEGLLAIGYRF